MTKKMSALPISPRKTTTLYIKNMVCPRCIRVVRDELTNLGFDVRSIALGEVELGRNNLSIEKVRHVLHENGFELIEDRRVKTIESIKHAVLKLVQNDHDKNPIRLKDSEFISQEVGQDYHSLSTLFSSVEGITIEQYIIHQKIERVKELLKYKEMTLSEISYTMGYSSVAHLSNQFKKVTGMTPSEFKKLGGMHRHPVSDVGKKR